jgi:hypothetical protein
LTSTLATSNGEKFFHIHLDNQKQDSYNLHNKPTPFNISGWVPSGAPAIYSSTATTKRGKALRGKIFLHLWIQKT